MRIVAFRTDPPVVRAILLHLEQGPPRCIAWGEAPPPLSPASEPPQGDVLAGLLDQTPAFDAAEPDPPDFEFDWSLPVDFNLCGCRITPAGEFSFQRILARRAGRKLTYSTAR